MPVEKQPFILQNNNQIPSLDDFQHAIALLPSDANDSKLYTDIMKAISMGLLNPSKAQMEAIRLLFNKKVPDAPKDINLHEDKQVAVIFAGFLKDNPMNFGNALQEASKNAEKEIMINNMIEGDIT